MGWPAAWTRSVVSTVANRIVGYGVAVVTQTLIFPIFALRRLFEAIRDR